MNNNSLSILAKMLEGQRLLNAHPGIEGKLRKWAKPPSETETDKCERTERMVKEAIQEDPKLSKLNITVFSKGSYKNRTNIPSDSDVDVGVRHNNLFINDYPRGMDKSDFGLVTANYNYSDFRNDVISAIKNKFKTGTVTIGDKSIKVKSSTARVDADVVVFTVHRRFREDKSVAATGVALKTTTKIIIYNWPDQNYSNSVNKNSNTKKRYKAFVRILKNLRVELKKDGYSYNHIPSFLAECLAWNVPNCAYDADSYKKMSLDCLKYLSVQLADINNVRKWGEVNELKYLFGTNQPWTLTQAKGFVDNCISFIEKQ